MKSAEAEKRYVYRALWNERKTMQRTVTRRRALRTQLQTVLPTHYETTGQLEAREVLGKLQAELKQADWETLLRVGLAGGVVAQAYGGGSRRTWFAQAKRARTRAAAI